MPGGMSRKRRKHCTHGQQRVVVAAVQHGGVFQGGGHRADLTGWLLAAAV